MVISENGHCPNCNAFNASITGSLEDIKFYKCKECGRRYQYKYKSLEQIIRETPGGNDTLT